MCGRFIQISDPERITVLFKDIEVERDAPAHFTPSYNVAPTKHILTILNLPTPLLTLTRWGLIPFWAKDSSIGSRMINARAETLASKPSFRDPLKKRRCLIFADGFYEWQSTGKTKTPFFVRLKTQEPFAMAGLWDQWANRETGEEIRSSTIITTDPNSVIATIHNRMPVILDPADYNLWLSSERKPDAELMACLKSYSPDEMEVYEISRMVNSPQNDSPECIRPVRAS